MQGEFPGIVSQDRTNDQGYRMRAPCPSCGHGFGQVIERGAQDTVRCANCDRFCYNAPRVETGKAVRSIASVHSAVKPKLRAQLVLRAGGACELCKKGFGSGDAEMHISHIISVKRGLEMGLTETELNDEENLIASCAECNVGLGDQPIPLRILVMVAMARLRRKQ